MIKKLPVLLAILGLVACKNDPKEPREISNYIERIQNRFPSTLQKVFDAHGGLDIWKKTQTFQFTIITSDVKETHTTDLKSRKTLIESDVYTIGFDGKNVWIKDDFQKFTGDANFYYNQMFYLFAMPFVVSDPGIFYTERKDTTLEFETYGTLHIGFTRSVGASPQDEYIIYYNKKTMEMAWLGYTVTYFDKKRSKEWHFIKYDKWQEVDGLKIPKTIVKYETKDGKPDKPLNKIDFYEIEISENQPDDNLFEAVDGSRFVK